MYPNGNPTKRKKAQILADRKQNQDGLTAAERTQMRDLKLDQRAGRMNTQKLEELRELKSRAEKLAKKRDTWDKSRKIGPDAADELRKKMRRLGSM